jgi:flagellar biosynthesis anti-sigma factor FlgM
MFRADLPIYVMRIASLNKARKSWELFDVARSREKTRRVPAHLCRIKLSCLVSTADSPNSAHRAFQKDSAALPAASPAPTPARMERVAALRAAIAQGRYHVSAADLAQKIMDHMLALHPPKNGTPKNRVPRNRSPKD